MERLRYRLLLGRQTRALNRLAAYREEIAGPPRKNLYVSPVGRYGKPYLEKIINRFGHEELDFLIFAYDDTDFDDRVFRQCRIIREPGMRWALIKKYLVPEIAANYGYIFLWADDIDIESFQQKRFLEIMKKNNLQVAQPALTRHSFFSHPLTLQHESCKTGRYTDFVEIMVPVFHTQAWEAFWNIIDPELSPWGWGLDLVMRSVCGYSNVGIIDEQPVTHTKPVKQNNTLGQSGLQAILEKYRECQPALGIAYRRLTR